MRLEHLEISFYVHFSASYGLKHIKICVTRDWNVDRKRSNNCILTDFEKLLYRSQTFAQTKFYSYIENIFSKFNHQKLNPFEGLAHGIQPFVKTALHSLFPTCFVVVVNLSLSSKIVLRCSRFAIKRYNKTLMRNSISLIKLRLWGKNRGMNWTAITVWWLSKFNFYANWK